MAPYCVHETLILPMKTTWPTAIIFVISIMLVIIGAWVDLNLSRVVVGGCQRKSRENRLWKKLTNFLARENSAGDIPRSNPNRERIDLKEIRVSMYAYFACKIFRQESRVIPSFEKDKPPSRISKGAFGNLTFYVYKRLQACVISTCYNACQSATCLKSGQKGRMKRSEGKNKRAFAGVATSFYRERRNEKRARGDRESRS